MTSSCPGISLIVLLCLMFCPVILWANMASPARAGQLNAEPNGLAKIAITRETLNVDLRSLPSTHAALVTAQYQLNNQGAAQTMELVFVAATENVQNFQVWLDDQTIASQITELENLPKSWQAPHSTPAIKAGNEISFAVFPTSLTKLLKFTLTIPPGAHKIKASYQSALSVNVSGKPTKYWQFAYVLAPARDWANFGGMDVTVHLPAGYQHAITPALTQEGDVLRGSFADVPADAIAMTLQSPPSNLYSFARESFTILFWVILPLGWLGLGWRGWQKGKQTNSVWWSALLHALGWAAMIGVGGFLALVGADYLLPEQELSPYGYEYIFAVVMLVCLVLGAFLLGLGTFAFTAKKSAHKMKES